MAGHEDRSIAASIKVLDQVLTDYGIPHVYEEYAGNHINRVAERIQAKMLPFFASHLSFAQPKGKGRRLAVMVGMVSDIQVPIL